MKNLIQTVDHSKKLITTYEVTDAVIVSAKEVLEMFSVSDENYSIGFQRYTKLSAAKVKRMNLALLQSGTNLQDIYSIIISKLESFTPEEFENFKKSK